VVHAAVEAVGAAAAVVGAKLEHKFAMKSLHLNSPAIRSRSGNLPRRAALSVVFTFVVIGTVFSRLGAAEPGKAFATPAELVTALDQAVNTTNRASFASLFGPNSDWLANPDTVQGARELKEFAAAFNSTNHLVQDSTGHMILEVGPSDWPFPIPIVKTANGWRFDTEAGREEILNRRIGHNELEVLRVLRAYVQAQREYASEDRDGDGVLEFAQRLTSSPGQTDGLYWPTDWNGETSPLGPLVADAQGEGYFGKKKDPDVGPQPFYGYYFKILTRQGKNAPGGKYDYIINGNMIAGFAMLAWPAEYGESGVMTFIVNQQGRVYQRDLGPKTAKLASSMEVYDPDRSWTLSPN
jgi:hypothetical protein